MASPSPGRSVRQGRLTTVPSCRELHATNVGPQSPRAISCPPRPPECRRLRQQPFTFTHHDLFAPWVRGLRATPEVSGSLVDRSVTAIDCNYRAVLPLSLGEANVYLRGRNYFGFMIGGSVADGSASVAGGLDSSRHDTRRHTPPIPAEHSDWIDVNGRRRGSHHLFDRSQQRWDPLEAGRAGVVVFPGIEPNGFTDFCPGHSNQVVVRTADEYLLGDVALPSLNDTRVMPTGTPIVPNRLEATIGQATGWNRHEG